MHVSLIGIYIYNHEKCAGELRRFSKLGKEVYLHSVFSLVAAEVAPEATDDM